MAEQRGERLDDQDALVVRQVVVLARPRERVRHVDRASPAATAGTMSDLGELPIIHVRSPASPSSRTTSR